MCFYRQTKRKKATEDIVVWKVMDPYHSLQHSEERVRSSLFHDDKKYPEGYGVGDTIEASWRYTKRSKVNAFLIDHFNTFLEGEVVHAYIDKVEVNHIPHWCRVVKLIIPAGNYYWTDDEDIVSTSMIIQEIIHK